MISWADLTPVNIVIPLWVGGGGMQIIESGMKASKVQRADLVWQKFSTLDEFIKSEPAVAGYKDRDRSASQASSAQPAQPSPASPAATRPASPAHPSQASPAQPSQLSPAQPPAQPAQPSQPTPSQPT